MKITNKEGGQVVAHRAPTHFIFVKDNSGSMYGSIENMKKDVKNNLAQLIEKDDTVSIITFSSSYDVQVAIANWDVKEIAKDTEAFNKVIDKHVYARGATCFNKPLEQAMKVIGEGQPDKAVAVLFLTDGYHNDG